MSFAALRHCILASASYAIMSWKPVSGRLLTGEFRFRLRNRCRGERGALNEELNAIQERLSKDNIAATVGDLDAKMDFHNILLGKRSVSGSTVSPLVAH